MRGKSDRRMLTIIHLLNLDVCSASCFTASISFLHAAARPYFLTTIPCAACDRVSIEFFLNLSIQGMMERENAFFLK